MALKKTKNTTIGGSALYNPWCRCQPARRAQRVNDEPVKVLNLLFFVYFIWKWGETLEKLHFFTFGPKQCFYLTHSVREYFEKLALKKNDGANNIQTFSESPFNFLQNRVVFCTLHPRGYTAGGLRTLQPPVPLSAARRAQRVNPF